MNRLTNNYVEVRVWDLEPHDAERGPFLVTQAGSAPDDDLLRESLFVLRPDGLWVDITCYLSTGQAEAMDEAVFDSTQQIMELLEQLGPEAKVADLPVSEDGLRAWLDGTAPGTELERLHQWVEHYLQRRRERQPGG